MVVEPGLAEKVPVLFGAQAIGEATLGKYLGVSQHLISARL